MITHGVLSEVLPRQTCSMALLCLKVRTVTSLPLTLDKVRILKIYMQRDRQTAVNSNNEQYVGSSFLWQLY